VLRYIREHSLISPGDKVVVAVSGGPDSVCLLYVLIALKKELDLKLHVATLTTVCAGWTPTVMLCMLAGYATGCAFLPP